MQLRPFAALAIAAAIALGTVACTAAPPAAPEQSAPAPGSAEQTGESGAGDTGTEAAPIEGWPAEVPVPDAELTQDASTGGQIVGVFQVADAAAGEAYAAQLEAAGFTLMDGGSTEVAGIAAQAYEGHGHIVATSIVEAAGTVMLSVAIQPA